VQSECPRYHVAYRPEEEGRWALPHGEFGLEVIALIGQWRFREHRSVPEMHRALLAHGVSITERSVTHLMQRYEELVALRVTDQERIKAQLQKQGHVILALDGLQPDVGHEVLWVVRDCLSEEILLARPLLSSTQGDLTALLTEVKELLEQLKVPVKGVISDGQETIGSAVAFVFPEVPHQRCQFHYLKDATKPLYEADRHAKTELKKQLRGVRPIERALEEHNTPENETVRGYCLAVRAALTDDGRSPLQPSGIKLYDRVTQVSDSIARGPRKKRLPPALKLLQQLLTKGLQSTALLWPPLQSAYKQVHQAAEILANQEQLTGALVRACYLTYVRQMQEQKADVGPLGEAIEHFCHITNNFAAGLFHCYDIEGLPRTNNDLEHCFGVARVHERRATGRRGAIAGVVVRGSVRVIAAVVTKEQGFSAEDLQLKDYQRWRDLRAHLQQCEEARRKQFRFRKDPATYLAALEAQLLE
jgi:MULE transposase domain